LPQQLNRARVLLLHLDAAHDFALQYGGARVLLLKFFLPR
jgi:hypothetical protein